MLIGSVHKKRDSRSHHWLCRRSLATPKIRGSEGGLPCLRYWRLRGFIEGLEFGVKGPRLCPPMIGHPRPSSVLTIYVLGPMGTKTCPRAFGLKGLGLLFPHPKLDLKLALRDVRRPLARSFDRSDQASVPGFQHFQVGLPRRSQGHADERERRMNSDTYNSSKRKEQLSGRPSHSGTTGSEGA